MKGEEFRALLPEDLRARKMLDNLLDMQKSSGPVGYSLQN
jgi:hypothetical protein